MPRRYLSPVRAQHRQGTRSRVLGAATVLFLRRGYLGTTVEAVANRAGVSVQTVYNTVGGKAKLLKAVYDVLLAGDEAPVPIAERPVFSAIRASSDPREALAFTPRWVASCGCGRVIWC